MVNLIRENLYNIENNEARMKSAIAYVEAEIDMLYHKRSLLASETVLCKAKLDVCSFLQCDIIGDLACIDNEHVIKEIFAEGERVYDLLFELKNMLESYQKRNERCPF